MLKRKAERVVMDTALKELKKRVEVRRMRIVLFTGKGGVGKTTTASATALRLADRGLKTLLLSTDIAHSLADALDVPLTGEPTEVAPSLWAVQIDTQSRFEAAWRDVQNFLVDMLSRSGVDPITADELTVLPGVDEVLALLAVRELAVAGDWDALVVDCAPTAETLRLLALPEALGWYLQKVFPAHRRIAKGHPSDRDAARPRRGDPAGQPVRGAAAAQRRSRRRAAAARRPGDHDRCGSCSRPESVVAAEARRTFTALALYGYCVDLVVANRVFPSGEDEWRAGWARAQQAQLAAIRESFAGLPVRELPYRAGRAGRRSTRCARSPTRCTADGDPGRARPGTRAAARRRRRRRLRAARCTCRSRPSRRSTSPAPATTWS